MGPVRLDQAVSTNTVRHVETCVVLTTLAPSLLVHFTFVCDTEYPDGTKAKDVPRFYTDAEGETKSVQTST